MNDQKYYMINSDSFQFIEWVSMYTVFKVMSTVSLNFSSGRLGPLVRELIMVSVDT